MRHIVYRRQKNDYYCGPACLQMVLSYFGIRKSQDMLAKILKTNTRNGTPKAYVVKALHRLGIKAESKERLTFAELRRLLERNIIIINYTELEQNISHDAIVDKITKTHIVLLDPWVGPKCKIPLNVFQRHWKSKIYKDTYNRWAVCIPKNQTEKI